MIDIAENGEFVGTHCPFTERREQTERERELQIRSGAMQSSIDGRVGLLKSDASDTA